LFAIIVYQNKHFNITKIQNIAQKYANEAINLYSTEIRIEANVRNLNPKEPTEPMPSNHNLLDSKEYPDLTFNLTPRYPTRDLKSIDSCTFTDILIFTTEWYGKDVLYEGYDIAISGHSRFTQYGNDKDKCYICQKLIYDGVGYESLSETISELIEAQASNSTLYEGEHPFTADQSPVLKSLYFAILLGYCEALSGMFLFYFCRFWFVIGTCVFIY